MKQNRGSPGWAILCVIAFTLAVLLLFAGCGTANADTPRLSGEFGGLVQMGRTGHGDSLFGREFGFKSSKRPAELFAGLRLDNGPGTAALCVDGRHTLRREDWLAWEDCLSVRAELPFSPNLMALVGWERRHRIGESRFVVGGKLTFGSGRGHD